MPYMDPTIITVEDHPDDPSYYVSVRKISDDDSNKFTEAAPYVDQPEAMVKDHLRTSCIDYEALPRLSTYEAAYYQASDVPYQYEVATNTSVFREDSTVEVLPDNEQIYEDPGYNKEEIYSWFEEKKFRKLKRGDIKCVRYVAY